MTLRLGMVFSAVASLAGCADAAETPKSANTGNPGTKQSQGNFTNEVEVLCNDCPPPGYKGPPLG